MFHIKIYSTNFNKIWCWQISFWFLLVHYKPWFRQSTSER